MKPKDSKPSATEVNSLRAWLVAQGVSPANAAQIAVSTITRVEISSRIRLWLKDRPKKK
jgi:hypothetical protein